MRPPTLRNMARAVMLATPPTLISRQIRFTLNNRAMISTLRSSFYKSLAGATLLTWAACLGAPAAPPSEKTGYAGTDTCKTCHEEIYNKFAKSPHFSVTKNGHSEWQNYSCESCHGAGAKHAESVSAEDIRQPAKLKPPETDRICLSCHLNMSTPVGRIAGGHAKDDVACTTCHNIHGTNGGQLVLHRPAEINAQCGS